MNGLEIILAAVLGFGLTALAGLFMIPWLHRLKFGQPIITEYGPTWHANKTGTPTMGGFLFIFGSLVAIVVGFLVYAIPLSGQVAAPQLPVQVKRTLVSLVMMLLFALIGFIDDYLKIRHKHNAGLSDGNKFLMQVLVTVCYLAVMGLWGLVETTVTLPLIGDVALGLWYYPICLVLIVGFVNAVNITDGVDGLCGSVTFVGALFFFIAACLLDEKDVALNAVAVCAAMVGYLIYNFYPAKVMMGDTGSMFLGGALVAMAFSLNKPVLLLFFGALYIIEMLTVVIQTTYYKLTHKRLFKMTPIHHQFELMKFSEVKICLLFSGVELVFCLLGLGWVLSLVL